MARSQSAGPRKRTRFEGAVSRRGAANNNSRNYCLRRLAHRPLGVHVLASTTLKEFARGSGLVSSREKSSRQPGIVRCNWFVHRWQFLLWLVVAFLWIPCSDRISFPVLFLRHIRRVLRGP